PNSRHPEPVYYPDGDYGGYGRSRQPNRHQEDRNSGVYRGSRNENEAEVFGTIIGGVAGGVIGHQRDRGDTLTGALIGALGGNIIGRQIDHNSNRQRNYRWQR
ncbi:MAG: glycine zipper 2TM domain-containing protein, partial [Candidatus Obscuribacterales bacterium]|nr:glycine zipper 2TM domain-containing protein [Candidatus Obscuribacterales bacterium]